MTARSPGTPSGMPSIRVDPGTVALYSDVGCAWATVAVHRFHEARRRLGLEGEVHLDHRLFSLEDVNHEPLSKPTFDGELAALGALAPEFGFQVWQGDPSTWPVSTLLAAEAVHAAKEQGLAASEALDLALRRALFAQSRCITMLHEILDVAAECPDVDEAALGDALESGRARGPMLRQARGDVDTVDGSPHFFLPDGSDWHNPGVELEWKGDPGVGIALIEHDDASAYDDLLQRAAGRTRA